MNLTLKQLAEKTCYTTDEVRVFLGLMEPDSHLFISELCQAAYDLGYEDGYDNATPE